MRSGSQSRGQSRPVLLVTGASRGIGAAIARAAATNGFDVAVGYADWEDGAAAVIADIAAAGGAGVALQADIADGTTARRLVAMAEDALGPLDGVVNNAGIMPETPFLEIDPDEWDRVIATDLSAVFHICQAAIPGMVARGSGAIVNISSRLGQIGWPHLAHYSAAKAGLLGLTKSLAREFGPAGIRVNAVAPGVTETDMTREVVQGETGRKRMAELPAGRFAQPSDIAASVLFLLSDAASMYHGQTLGPNGGGYMP